MGAKKAKEVVTPDPTDEELEPQAVAKAACFLSETPLDAPQKWRDTAALEGMRWV